MSFQITTAFVQQYTDNVQLLVQQKGSRLRGTTMEESVNGKNYFFDQIGSTSARQVTERHGDSPLMNTPHARRMVTMSDYDWGDLIDKFDRVRTLADFTSPYVQNAGFAMGRAIDTVILTSLFATAYVGETGTTTVAFPGSSVIPVNFGGANIGLTVEKLREARRLLKAGNVDMTDPFTVPLNAKRSDDLLGTTQVTSADYNSVKALVQGEIDTFVGFKFPHTELIQVDSNGYDRIPAYAKSGVALAVGMEVTSRVTERSDKRFSTYVYYCMSLGATRMEEEKVIEIKCTTP
jgi:hypothetical protein